jgi:hypothetical protein
MPGTLTRPNWALPQDVIGYTFADRLSPTSLGKVSANPYHNGYPSVYYEGGHATLDHKQDTNIGWHGPGACLYFGNVPATLGGDAIQVRNRNKDAEKNAFIGELQQYPNYCNPTTQKWQDVVCPKGSIVLVEIWKTGHTIWGPHASRNRFRWIKGDQILQIALHHLAESTIKKFGGSASTR